MKPSFLSSKPAAPNAFRGVVVAILLTAPHHFYPLEILLYPLEILRCGLR